MQELVFGVVFESKSLQLQLKDYLISSLRQTKVRKLQLCCLKPRKRMKHSKHTNWYGLTTETCSKIHLEKAPSFPAGVSQVCTGGGAHGPLLDGVGVHHRGDRLQPQAQGRHQHRGVEHVQGTVENQENIRR